MIYFHKFQGILFGFFLLCSASCNFERDKVDDVWTDLPEAISLDSLKNTEVVLTLENQISQNKNIIYTPIFLYAWDKIKEELKSPIIIDSTSANDFKLINQLSAQREALEENEYTIEAKVNDGAIIARAFFNKTMPFPSKLEAIEGGIVFDKTTVTAVGMYDYDEEIVKFVKILYYKDDSNFILKLSPKDERQEIILVKGLKGYQTLQDAIQLTHNLIDKGKKEEEDNSSFWKYQIEAGDLFAIPIIKFNIGNRFQSVEGQVFVTSDANKHILDEAYQRIGFILNEEGAVVESEVLIAVDSIAEEPIIRRQKKLIFNEPFLIIIKKSDRDNPYFVMKVTNTELLSKL